MWRGHGNSDPDNTIRPRRDHPHTIPVRMLTGKWCVRFARDREAGIAGARLPFERLRDVVHLDHGIVCVVAMLHPAVTELQFVIETQTYRITPERAVRFDVICKQANVEVRFCQSHGNQSGSTSSASLSRIWCAPPVTICMNIRSPRSVCSTITAAAIITASTAKL